MLVGFENTITLFGGGASFSTTVAGGAITAVTILTGGCYYAAPPTLAVIATGGDTITVPAVLTAILTNGVVTSVIIVDGGAGYNHPPTITVTLALGASSVISTYMDPDGLYSLEQYRQSLLSWSVIGGVNTFGVTYPDVPSMIQGIIRAKVILPALSEFPTNPIATAQTTAIAATGTLQNLLITALSAPIICVQSVAGSQAPGHTSATLYLGAAASYGHTLIVCVSTASTSGGAFPAVSTMTCSNVAFTRIASRTVNNTNWSGWNNLEMWIGVVVGSLSDTSIAVTFPVTTNTYYTEMTAAEFSGLAMPLPGIVPPTVLDGAVVQFGSLSAQSACSAGPYSNTNPSDLIFAVLEADIAGPPTTPAGFTAMTSGVNAGSWGLWPVYQIASGISSFTANWSGGFGGGATNTFAFIVGFQGA